MSLMSPFTASEPRFVPSASGGASQAAPGSSSQISPPPASRAYHPRRSLAHRPSLLGLGIDAPGFDDVELDAPAPASSAARTKYDFEAPGESYDEEHTGLMRGSDVELGAAASQTTLPLYAAPRRDSGASRGAEQRLARGQALGFEPVTPREKMWMWTSVALVVVLTLVAVGECSAGKQMRATGSRACVPAISLDWIDWPGDGIGEA
ncbi:hypothetical protein FA09DRAFT_118389 [Tilletiopsis washingtonensis]|jgi:hypothetical protein|uniref:Uncharacterized protein n=1 Tax=Tilletiopsis washingtonensis TaxID=58919 RepID=A0A316ZII7_9BASI|nr:hypothetical protein FA09DRAFT_118389 [Tilletiopsis washingtonensis]PWO00899.1 hypothetical protein FA09DRAFT_118389 [Tilletiopsis washingtonensis]